MSKQIMDSSFDESIEPVENVQNDEVVGVVTNCQRLNVRKEPDADSEVVTVISQLEEVVIDTNRSTEEWYAVCLVSGIEGFCMKKFIVIN